MALHHSGGLGVGKSTEYRDDLVGNFWLDLFHDSRDGLTNVNHKQTIHFTVEEVWLDKINYTETDWYKGTLQLSNMIIHCILMP